MTDIVNTGTPSLTLRKEIRARLNCPNCDAMLDLDANSVDVGHIIRCGTCEKKTYYPFERPWYRRRKLIVGYALSIVVSFIVGLSVNYAYAYMTKETGDVTATDAERK